MAEPKTTFDPIGLLKTLDQTRVSYIVVGAFARVARGSDEFTRGVDIVPVMREDNLRRLDRALHALEARGTDGKTPDLEAMVAAGDPVLELSTTHGELKIVPEPAGTQGYEDLRRGATAEYLGPGVRADVASVGDLARMLGALGREDDIRKILTLRRITELELERGLGLGLEL